MKRKRGAGRRKPTKKANVTGADKGTENFMASNAGEQSGWSDAANDPVDTGMEVDIAQAKSTTSRGPTAGLDNDKSNEKTSRGNSLHGNNVFKDVASFAAKLSRAVGSSTSDPRIDARPLQDEMTNAGEQMSSRHDPLDNKKELNAALSVIKTIMKMDAAKPFNSPVDPVALGIPDYFDIIDTPMDFDTICNNIDLGFKYRNSEDIYRDVELIWDNCSKYNKNGTKITELMKQAKTKFLKLWSAAGLYIQRQEPSNVHSGKSLPHATEDSVRHNYRGHAHLDGSMISNSIHQGKPWLMGEDIHPPHPSCFSYEYQPPHISSQCSCSWCFRGSQSSMYHNTWHNSPGGSGIEKHYNQRQFETSSQHEHPHRLQFHDRWWQHQPSFDPHQASLQKARMNSQNPDSSNVYSNQQKQWQMYSSHTDGYHPGLTHADDLHHHSNIPQFPCHEPGVPSTYSAGHPHLNSLMEATPRHTKRVQEDLTALDPDGPSLQKHQRVVETQVNSCSRKHSPARQEENNDSAGHPHLSSPMEAIPRHAKRVQEDLTALDTDGPSLQKHQRVVETQVNSSSRKHSPARHEENNDSAGHPHLNSPMEAIPRHTKRVHEDLTALDPDGPSLQKHQRVVATQVNSCFRKHSPARHEENSGSSGHIHVTPARESSVRPPTCRPESSAAPDMNYCSSEEYQMDQNEPDSPLSDDCAMPVPEEDANLSQPGSSTPEASPLGNEHAIVEADSSALEKKSRGRGPTRCLKLLFQGKRMSITTNELGQPVGVDARKLISFLGTIARDGHKAPLNYLEWRAMPEVHKENMWKEVQEKFIIDPKSKYWIMKSLSKKWKDWKARLKSERYLTRATSAERLANLDERVLPDQWEYLVSHWKSEKAERRSAINKACNAKLVFRHVGGSKSYARLREEEKEKRPDKKPPSRAELFIMTRMRKDGTPVNEETSAIIEKLRQTQDTAETSTVQDEAFVQIVGRRKNGLVRCVELGTSPSDLLTRKHSQEVANQLALEAKAEVLEIKNKMGTMEETCAQMATQMAAMMSMMSSLQKNISDGNVPGPDASIDQGSQDNGWNRPPIHKAYSRRLEHYPRKRENMGTSSTPGSSVEPNSTPDLGTPHLPRASGSRTFCQTRPDQAHNTSGTREELSLQHIRPTPSTTRTSRKKRV